MGNFYLTMEETAEEFRKEAEKYRSVDCEEVDIGQRDRNTGYGRILKSHVFDLIQDLGCLFGRIALKHYVVIRLTLLS